MLVRKGLLCIGCAVWVSMAGAVPVEFASEQAGTIYLGAIADRDWGRPVAAGDLDGDGYDEVLVSASESWGGYISHVYIVRGGPGAAERGVVDLSAGGVDQVIIGAALDDNLGSSFAFGDVNGDGYDDLLVCASSADNGSLAEAGVAYLFYGGPSFFASPVRDLSVAGSWNVKIGGPQAYGDLGGAGSFNGFDAHAAAIGNLNGDSYGDIVLGVHSADGDTGRDQAGRVYVVFGAPFPTGTSRTLTNSSHYDVLIYGKSTYDETGDFVLTGDLTGDGLDELIIPNCYYSQALFGCEGAVHIYRGRTTWTKNHYLRTTPADITLLGWRKYDELGTSAAVGDFNGDGTPDLAAAAPGAELGTFTDQRGDGVIYGLFGSPAYQTGTHTMHFGTATPDFRFVGESEENLGTLIEAGDFNGDGYDDIAAAERFAGPQTNGVVEVLFGRAFAGNPTFTANLDTDAHIVGAPEDRIGFSLTVSDVDGDGVHEVLFGTPFNNGSYPNEAGTAYVFSLLVCGDLDGDLDVDADDYAIFRSTYGRSLGDPAYVPAADFDGDGRVTLVDYQQWLACYRDFVGNPAAQPPVVRRVVPQPVASQAISLPDRRTR
ncbi:MAG: FG-GAP repeat protein [Phycisphaerae bacterium]|nr:FG-GAP repeat protein [Phycisphaerae bacterium]